MVHLRRLLQGWNDGMGLDIASDLTLQTSNLTLSQPPSPCWLDIIHQTPFAVKPNPQISQINADSGHIEDSAVDVIAGKAGIQHCRMGFGRCGLRGRPQTKGRIWIRPLASGCEIRYDDGMGKAARRDVLNLSVAERIELIGDLWDSLAGVPEAVVLTEGQKAELDRRLDAYHNDPAAGAPWPVVRDRIAKRK